LWRKRTVVDLEPFGGFLVACLLILPFSPKSHRRSSRSFSAYDHFLALCFGQLTYREIAASRFRRSSPFESSPNTPSL
jgi:hypothetical protein